MEDINVGGRPSLLDEQDDKGNFINEKVLTFFKIYANCGMEDTSCRYAKIAEQTFNDWKRIGNRHLKEGVNSKYARFSIELRKLDAEFELKNFIDIRNNKDWKAKRWVLAVTKRHKYSDRAIEGEQINDENNIVQVVLGSKKDDSNK